MKQIFSVKLLNIITRVNLFFLNFSPLPFQSRDGTQFMGQGGVIVARRGAQTELIQRDSSWGSKAKVLQEGGDEDEELHPGQTLSRTSSATCVTKKTNKTKTSNHHVQID